MFQDLYSIHWHKYHRIRIDAAQLHTAQIHEAQIHADQGKLLIQFKNISHI